MMRSNRVRRLVATLVTTTALSFGGLALAQAASAAPAGCPSGAGCAWKDRYYLTAGASTPVVTFQNYIANFTTIAGTWDNQVTSIYDNGTNTSLRIYWYTDINYGGSALTLTPGQGYDQLNVQQPLFNDRISSARFAS